MGGGANGVYFCWEWGVMLLGLVYIFKWGSNYRGLFKIKMVVILLCLFVLEVEVMIQGFIYNGSGGHANGTYFFGK